MRRLLPILASVTLFVGAVAFTHAQVPMTGAGLSKPTAAGGGCSPATTFLARTSGLSGTETTAVTNLMCGLVTDGLFTNSASGYCTTNFDVIYIFAINTTTTALLNVCSTSFGGTANGAPSFSADAGYTGVDSSNTVFIDTGFNPSTAGGNFSQNSAHLSIWSNTNTTSGASGGITIGSANLTSTNQLSNVMPKYNDGNAYFRITESGSGSAGTANANSTGHYLANRSGASAEQGYKNGSSILTNTTASASLVNGNLYVLAQNQVGSSNLFGSAIQIGLVSIGASLNSTQVGNLCHRFNLYMTAVNGNAAVC
jgi:hypothetical protein